MAFDAPRRMAEARDEWKIDDDDFPGLGSRNLKHMIGQNTISFGSDGAVTQVMRSLIIFSSSRAHGYVLPCTR